MNEWISVKDRMPELHVEVLVYGILPYEIHPEIHQCYLCDVNGKNKLEFWTSISAYDVKNVTHWMPLPEPPKE